MPNIVLVPTQPLRQRPPAGKRVVYVRMPTPPAAAPVMVGLLLALIVLMVVAAVMT